MMDAIVKKGLILNLLGCGSPVIWDGVLHAPHSLFPYLSQAR